MSAGNLDDNMPKIMLEKEDREAYQRSRSQHKQKPSKTNKEQPPHNGSEPSSTTPYFLWILLLATMAASGWLWHQNQQQQQQLTHAYTRLNELENRLSATGEEMGESAVAMQVKVKELAAKANELWNQMDKLWASAWRRNQQDIKALDKQLDKQQQNLQQRLEKTTNSVASNHKHLDTLKQSLTTQTEQLAVLDMSLSQVALTGSEREIEITALREKLTVLEQRNSALLKRLTELEKWAQQQSTPQVKAANKPPAAKVAASAAKPSSAKPPTAG